MKLKLVLVCMLALAAAGCLGKSGPGETYLRVHPGSLAGCGATLAGEQPLVLSIKAISSLPNLDRQAVLFGHDNVLRPSRSWYWEGAPSMLMLQYLDYGLTCSNLFRVVQPYRPRLELDAVLTGRVMSFEVLTGDAPSFRLGFYLDVWDGNGQWLAGRAFAAKTPLAELTPSRVAAAANASLDRALADVVKWLDSSVARRVPR